MVTQDQSAPPPSTTTESDGIGGMRTSDWVDVMTGFRRVVASRADSMTTPSADLRQHAGPAPRVSRTQHVPGHRLSPGVHPHARDCLMRVKQSHFARLRDSEPFGQRGAHFGQRALSFSPHTSFNPSTPSCSLYAPSKLSNAAHNTTPSPRPALDARLPRRRGHRKSSGGNTPHPRRQSSCR